MNAQDVIDKSIYFEYCTIIVWKQNSPIINKIEEIFKDKIIETKIYNLSKEDRINKVKKIYSPIYIPDNDLRCQSDEPIKLYILRLQPLQKYYYRSEGYKLCNIEILKFKLEARRNFDYTHFHSSDHFNEAKQIFETFGLNNYLSHCALVDVKDIYHFIHLESSDEGYTKKIFKILPIENSITVKYLIGYKDEYINSCEFFNPRESTLEYFGKMKPFFHQGYPNYIITASKYKDKYIITDGMHRSSVLYFNGNRHIFVHLDQVEKNYIKYITDEQIVPKENPSHLENFNEMIYRINNNNIRMIVIRGFSTMPFTADTDLDIIVHPVDYKKFIELMEIGIKEGRLISHENKLYKHNKKELWYRSFRTTGQLGDYLTNKCYQFDCYNNAFFFKNGEEGVTLSDNFVNYLFENKVLFKNFYIPNLFSELTLIICRNLIDKQNNWSPKHKEKLKFLLHNHIVNKEEFNKFIYEAFQPDLSYLKIKDNLIDYTI